MPTHLKTIVVFGSGRSATFLIEYLVKSCQQRNWKLIIADKHPPENIEINLDESQIQFFQMDIENEASRNKLIATADIVVSMLPVRFHPLVLQGCLKHRVDLVTPSYESEEMRSLAQEIEDAGILVLNEMGLDPGIDHMSAMKVIDEIRENDNTLTAFESFTGGLIAPEYDDNPWRYKFTWNPRNVVLAGSGNAVRFLHNGKFKYIPYHKVFRRTERIEIDGFGSFEGYANRDSLDYMDKYNLKDIATIYRGTLRRPGFCRAWDIFVQLGLTDDSFIVEDSYHMTFRQFVNSFLPYNPHDSVELKVMQYLKIDQDSGLMEKLKSLNLFSDQKIGLEKASPAKILEHILKQSWTMEPDDQDMIVMWHKFFYTDPRGRNYQRTSSFGITGENAHRTAMAKTVGLPIGIFTTLYLDGAIEVKGLKLPVSREIYNPILEQLAKFGVDFKDQEEPQQENLDNQPIF